MDLQQAPETFTKGTFVIDRALQFDLATKIAKGLEFAPGHQESKLHAIDLLTLFGGVNCARRVLPHHMQVGVSLYMSEGEWTLDRLHEEFGITYLEFAGSPLVDSIGRRFNPLVSRLPSGTWYWYVRNLAYCSSDQLH